MATDRDVKLRLEVSSIGGDGASALDKLAKQAEAAANRMRGVKKDTEETRVVLRSLGGEILKVKGPFSERDIDTVHKMDVGLQRLAKTNLDLAMSIQRAMEAETKRALVQKELAARGFGGGAGGEGAKGPGFMMQAGMGAAKVLGTAQGIATVSSDVANVMGMFRDIKNDIPFAAANSNVNLDKGIIGSVAKGLAEGFVGIAHHFQGRTDAYDASRLQGRAAEQLRREQDYQREYDIRKPFLARRRELGEERHVLEERYGVGGPGIRVPFQGVERFQHRNALTEYQDNLAWAQRYYPDMRDYEGRSTLPYLKDQAGRFRTEVLEGRKGTEETDRGLAMAERATRRAVQERIDLEDKYIAKKKIGFATLSEERAVQEQILQSTMREHEAKLRLLEATKAHGAAERERLTNARDWAKSNKQMFQGMQASEGQRLEGMQAQYGQMSAIDRMRAQQAMKKAINGGFENLTPEEQQLAGRFLPDQHRQFGLDVAKREGFEALQERGGELRKFHEAGQMEKFFGKIEAEFNAKIEAEIKINEAALADQVQLKIIPPLLKAFADIARDMELEVSRQIKLMNLARNTNAGGR